MPFSYDPGFRVGAHYEFTSDHWNASLIYSHFKQSVHNAVTGSDTLFLNNILQPIAINPDTISAKINESFQTIDFVMGKKFSLNNPFSLYYYAGIKWARIKEAMDTISTGSINASPLVVDPITTPFTFTNVSKAIGLMGGAEISFDLKKGISLYSRGEIALLQSKFNVSQQQILEAPTLPGPIILNNTQTYKSIKPNFVLELGLEWSKSFYCDRFSAGFNVGYELNYWPTQLLPNQIIFLGDPTDPTNPFVMSQPTIDVGFTGFNFGAYVTF